VVFFLAIVNLLGYMISGNINAIIFFILVAYLAHNFSKNMIVVLLTPLVITSLLMVGAQIKEGMESKRDDKKEKGREKHSGKKDEKHQDKKDKKTEDKRNEDKKNEDKKYEDKKNERKESDKNLPSMNRNESGYDAPGNMSGSMSDDNSGDKSTDDLNDGKYTKAFEDNTNMLHKNGREIKDLTNRIAEDEDKLKEVVPKGKSAMTTMYKKGSRIDYAATVEDAYADLNKILGGDGIKNLTSDTQRLMEQQTQLADAMKGMSPLLEQAKSMLQGFDMKNLDGLASMAKNFGKQ